MNYALVFVGGGLGATLRYAINVAFGRAFGTAFPWHTLFENVTGSVVMGLLAGYFAFRSGESAQTWRLFLTTGVLGGYTTFSAFSLDSWVLYERGAVGLAAVYVLASVAVSLSGVFAGLMLMRGIS